VAEITYLLRTFDYMIFNGGCVCVCLERIAWVKLHWRPCHTLGRLACCSQLQ